MKELAEYDEVRKIVRQGKGTVALSGCVDSQKLHMIYGLSDGLKYKVIVTYNDLKAKEIYEEYRFYDRNVMLYPAKDLIFFQADIHGNQLVQERIKTLRRVVEGKPVTIVTTYAALMTPQVLWEEKDIIHTERGGSLDESKLASRLVAMGYEKAYQVESPGQFSVRGGIVDIFDLTEENPYRIELWGDEVESIRSFDILSQRPLRSWRVSRSTRRRSSCCLRSRFARESPDLRRKPPNRRKFSGMPTSRRKPTGSPPR